MNIYPAIDIMEGSAVRLTKGDYNTKEIFSSCLQSVKENFKTSGATHLHVVDLDGAKAGLPVNFKAIEKLCFDKDMFVEVGGGIRNLKTIEDYLNVGVSRIILGTGAVKNHSFLKDAVKLFKNKIAVSVDAKDGFVAISGWEETSIISSFDFVNRLFDEGIKTIIYTDIATDGVMGGTNMEAFTKLSKIKGLDVIASGGITYLDEIVKLKELKISGAILGKALYKGLIDLSEAVRVANGDN